MSDWICYCDHCTGRAEPPPEPCQYCSVMAGEMKECDKSCAGLTEEKWIELNRTTK